MIKDKKICEHIISEMNNCAVSLDQTIRMVQEQCSQDEFEKYRKAAGFVLGYIYTDVLRPIYRDHPDLEPSDLKID